MILSVKDLMFTGAFLVYNATVKANTQAADESAIETKTKAWLNMLIQQIKEASRKILLPMLHVPISGII